MFKKRSCTHQNCSRAMVAIMLQELSLFSTNAIYWKTCCFIQGILIPIKLIARALDHLRTHHFFSGIFQGISLCLSSFRAMFFYCQPWFWGTQLEQKSEFFQVQLQRASHEIVAPASIWPTSTKIPFSKLPGRCMVQLCGNVVGYLLQLIQCNNKLPHTKTKER